MSYTLSHKTLQNLKSSLTRAKNRGSVNQVIQACDEALAVFEKYGYPDCWSDWQRAKDDAEFQKTFANRRMF